MLIEFVRRKEALRLPAATDDLPRLDLVAKVALALRGVFPNITPAQAEQAALQLTACRRPPSHDRRPSRLAMH
jgi:hypothetical protein